MKKILSILLFAGISAFGQAPAIAWQKSLGGTNIEDATWVEPTPDGGFIVAGYTYSGDGNVTGLHGPAGNYHDVWLVKLSASGAIEWQKCLGGTNHDRALCIRPTAEGGYIFTGATMSNDGNVFGLHGTQYTDIWVVKITSTGAITWQKCLGGTNIDESQSIAQTSDGGYIVAGWTYSTNGDVTSMHGSCDAWIIKLGATGAIQWQKTYGGSGFDYARSVIQAADGNYVMAGYTRSTDGDVVGVHTPFADDFWILKLNSADGSILWQKCLGGDDDEEAKDIKQTPDGGYIIAGSSSSTDTGDVTGHHGSSDFWVVKTNGTGDIEWQKSLGGTKSDEALSVDLVPGNGYVVSGSTYSNDGDVSGLHGSFFSSDFWVVRLDEAGTLLWQKCLGGSSGEEADRIFHTSDGGFITTGESYSNNDGDVTGHWGNSDYWVVKLAPESLGTPAFDRTKITLYPNPAGKILQIEGIVAALAVIYDGAGKKLGNVSFTENKADVSAFPAGTYFIEITDGNGRIARRKFIKI